MNLPEITIQLQYLNDSIEASDGVITPEQEMDLERLAKQGEAEICQLARLVLRLEADAETASKWEEKMRARRKSLEDRSKRIRALITVGLREGGLTRANDPDGLLTVRLQESRGRVEFYDENSISELFYSVEEVRKYKTDLLRTQLEAGYVVEGARLVKDFHCVIR